MQNLPFCFFVCHTLKVLSYPHGHSLYRLLFTHQLLLADIMGSLVVFCAPSTGFKTVSMSSQPESSRLIVTTRWAFVYCPLQHQRSDIKPPPTTDVLHAIDVFLIYGNPPVAGNFSRLFLIIPTNKRSEQRGSERRTMRQRSVDARRLGQAGNW